MHLADAQSRKRRTGRTTRLLADAARRIKDGKKVCIITPHVQSMQREFMQKHKDTLLPDFQLRIPDGFDWRMMRPPGGDLNTVWLIDHVMLEQNPDFQAMFEMMTRYDRMDG